LRTLNHRLRQGLTALAFSFVASVASAQSAYDGDGPLPTRAQEGGLTCTIFHPREIKPGAHVILWGNGTGTRPVDYADLLHQLASYGFVVAAAHTPTAGSGADMLQCLDWLTAENAREGGPYFGKLDLSKVGATGHSQGGGGAVMAGRDPRITVTAPIMPAVRDAAAPTQQHGPMLLLSAGIDTFVSPERQQAVFAASTVPTTWLTRKEAGHLTAMGDAGPYRAAVTAWFLYQLENDAKAGALFKGEACAYCTDPAWTVQKKNSP
jgi:hypothetical protein